jgi:elongation factor P--(R)-beta-lysine ligase
MEEHLFALSAGDKFLRTSPEFALKRVVASGLPRIYEIGPCFRGREHGPWHSTEFLLLEWYRVGAGLSDLMDEVEELVAQCAGALGVLAPTTWQRVSVRELFRRHTGLDLAEATAAEISEVDGDNWTNAFLRRWVNDIEPQLKGPTFVFDWPAELAALARVRDDGDWPTAQRFEVYLSGLELANAFWELIDSGEQERRFEAANESRQQMGEAPHPLDQKFIAAVGTMPPTSGIAMGIERLVACLCGYDCLAKTQVR